MERTGVTDAEAKIKEHQGYLIDQFGDGRVE